MKKQMPRVLYQGFVWFSLGLNYQRNSGLIWQDVTKSQPQRLDCSGAPLAVWVCPHWHCLWNSNHMHPIPGTFCRDRTKLLQSARSSMRWSEEHRRERDYQSFFQKCLKSCIMHPKNLYSVGLMILSKLIFKIYNSQSTKRYKLLCTFKVQGKC